MKTRVFILLLFVAFAWIGCDEREIPTYSGARYIEFEDLATDSTIFSFVYHPSEDYYDLPVAMKIDGQVAEEDLIYRLAVNEEASTAEAKHYSLENEYVFSAGQFKDTCFVRLNKTDDLSTNKVRLVLYLESTADLQVGKMENSVMVIQLSNTVARPDWWTVDVEDDYLGTYSDRKFTLFIQVTGADDLSGATDSQIRAFALKFKQYLIEHEGEPETLETDGQPMKVTVKGLE